MAAIFPLSDNWRGGPARLAALTLVAVMAIGSFQFWRAAQHSDGRIFSHTLADFLEGRTTAELQKQLDLNMPAREQLITLANSLRYLLTRGTGEQVRRGTDDWLFLTEELRFHANGNRHLEARAELLGAAARQLERQGTKLIVALVPDKARVHAGNLSGGSYPPYLHDRYPHALAAMQRNGVTAVDLLEPLTRISQREAVYYRSDTHWNQAGAKAAAEAVAQVVRQTGIPFDRSAFSTAASAAPVERPGDLIRLMGLEQVPNMLRPAPDLETPVVTSLISADKSAGLFGDTSMPVALTGTSYSLRANFHGFLQQALSAQVLNTAKDGGGFLEAATDYLTNEAFTSSKPRILIWELPERFLELPLDQEAGWVERTGLLR